MSRDRNDSPGPSDSPRAGRPWFRFALIGSLALNLFFVGVAGVWAVKPFWRSHFGPPPPVAENLAERMSARLPEADRHILRQAVQKRQDEIRAHMKTARGAQRDIRRTLTADPFDPDAFTAASNRARAEREAAQIAMHQAMREAAIAMSAEGRARLAQPPRGSRGD